MIKRTEMPREEALNFLYSRHAKEMKLGLEHIRDLLRRLGNPQDNLKAIHIAGTNGKGSTAAILEAILRAQGFKTGLFTSPHLIRLNERLQISGRPIPDQKLFEYIERLRPHAENSEASFFEIITAIGFLYFVEENVDVAVIETGLGGRLDATNTLNPVLTIITEIGLDHTKILGGRLLTIAGEKAGILKPGVPFVCGAKNPGVQDYFRQIAKEKNVPVIMAQNEAQVIDVFLQESGTTFSAEFSEITYKNLTLRLLGEHQIENCMTVLNAIHVLQQNEWGLSEQSIRQGLQTVSWPARLDLLQTCPKILLDSAHNPMGMKRLVHALKTLFTYKKLILVYGVLADKAYEEMSEMIVPLADTIILTKPVNDRALGPETLGQSDIFRATDLKCIESIPEAYHAALNCADPEDLICATGSLYFVGEILYLWQQNKIDKN